MPNTAMAFFYILVDFTKNNFPLLLVIGTPGRGERSDSPVLQAPDRVRSWSCK